MRGARLFVGIGESLSLSRDSKDWNRGGGGKHASHLAASNTHGAIIRIAAAGSFGSLWRREFADRARCGLPPLHSRVAARHATRKSTAQAPATCTGDNASMAAFSITERGAFSPVQISNCRAA